MMLELDPDQLKAVRDFCEITGTTVETVIYEALADHIECCLPPRLEEFAERSGAWPDAYSTISHYLGHANLNTTNRYVKVDLEMGAPHSYPRGIGLTRRLGAELQHNPALFVKGPKFSRKMGVTPIMEAKEVRVLLDSIAIMPRIKVPKKLGGGHKEVADIKGLRDRAAMAIMV